MTQTLDHLASAQRIWGFLVVGNPPPLTIHAFGDQRVRSEVLKVGKTHRSIFHTVAIMTMSLSRWKVSNLPYKHPFLFLPSFFCLSIVFCFLPLLHPQGLKMFFFSLPDLYLFISTSVFYVARHLAFPGPSNSSSSQSQFTTGTLMDA